MSSSSTEDCVLIKQHMKLNPSYYPSEMRVYFESVFCNAWESGGGCFCLIWSALGLIITPKPGSTVTNVLFTTNRRSCLIHENCILTYQMQMHERTAVKTLAMKCLAGSADQQQPPCRCAWATMNASSAHWIWNVSTVQSDDDKSKPLL